MNKEKQRIAVAEIDGWKPLPHPQYWWKYGNDHLMSDELPDYPGNRDHLYAAMASAGLMDVANLALRVKWVNTLRNIVSKRCPVNHIGTPICSDVDLLLATTEELCEALLRTMDRWVAEPETDKLNHLPSDATVQ